MFNYNLAYRFAPTPSKPEGHIEGFSGCAFIAGNARENAIRKIRIKLEILKHPFEESRLIETTAQLSQCGADLRELRKDWKVSQRSEITCT